MRITVTLPDEIGEAVRSRATNISAFVAEAIREKLRAIERMEARERLRRLLDETCVDPSILETLQEERRAET